MAFLAVDDPPPFVLERSWLGWLEDDVPMGMVRLWPPLAWWRVLRGEVVVAAPWLWEDVCSTDLSSALTKMGWPVSEVPV